MLQGLYSAATSMDAADLQHTIVSRNLANINVPGFRRMFVHQHSEGAGEAQDGGGGGTQRGQGAPEIAIDFQAGGMERTDRALDVGLMGEGFFGVEGPGGPLYTRNGSFHVNPEGVLVTAEGLPVRADGGGTIQIPTNASESDVTVSATGNVAVGGRSVGVLERVTFADTKVLQPQGASLFEVTGGVTPIPIETAVQSGMRERSNVVPATELVLMITGMRQYEAAQRMMQTIGSTLRDRIDLGGK